MNKLMKFSIAGGTLLALSAIAAQGVFAAAAPKFAWAKVIWNQVPGAVKYNIYFKESNDKTWVHAVPDLPSNSTSYNITYLKRGVTYWYTVAAENGSGAEFWWSGNKKLTSQPMK